VKARELLTAGFVLVATLLVWPLLGIPNRPVLVAGVPALALYLFAVWALVIAVLAWAALRGSGDDGP